MPIASYPPTVTHTTRPLPLPTAQSLIATYLARSESSAHLHLDALLSTSGVQFSTHGGPLGGLVLHNLRRVEAGLRGEHLAPDPKTTFEDEGDDARLDELIAETEARMEDGEGGRGGTKRKLEEVEGGGQADGEVEGWEDMESYQRAQEGIEEGELGDRSHVVRDGGMEPEVRETGPGVGGAHRREVGKEVDGKAEKQVNSKAEKQVNGKAEGKVDKEARKKAKKERGKAEKREREAKRRKEKEEKVS